MEIIKSQNTETLMSLIAELNDIEERFSQVLADVATAKRIDAYYTNESKNFDNLKAYFGKCLVASIVNDNSHIEDALAE